MGELLWPFVLHHQALWGTSSWDTRAPAISTEELRPVPGELALGLLAEAAGVYRVWSRFVLDES